MGINCQSAGSIEDIATIRLRVSDLPPQALKKRLTEIGLTIPCGPFNVRIKSELPHVCQGLVKLYADFPLLTEEDFIDFEVNVRSTSRLRRIFRPQVRLECDGYTPFKPLPMSQAFAMLEWGLNWVLSSHAHDFLVIHAAVVEREGSALILAADPGSGKSTLCAALVNAGWRLLSDELALIELASGSIFPIARPISLKNRSIEIVRNLGKDIVIGDICRDTAKGDVAHVKPPSNSVQALGATAKPHLIIFPRYSATLAPQTSEVGKAHSLAELTRHAFNAPILGRQSFETLATLVESTNTFRVTYSSFSQCLPEIDRLWQLNP